MLKSDRKLYEAYGYNHLQAWRPAYTGSQSKLSLATRRDFVVTVDRLIKGSILSMKVAVCKLLPLAPTLAISVGVDPMCWVSYLQLNPPKSKRSPQRKQYINNCDISISGL